MIESIKNTSVYKNLNLAQNLSQQYLFYSIDKELNNNVALTFAKSLLCNTHSICGVCPACKQFESHSHPDLTIIEQDSIKVEDANKFMSKLSTLPISSNYKVFVILNAETINEVAQNKLLKSLEEPNASNIFILTTTKTDKLLPTILSRLNKIYIPKLTKNDKSIISNDLRLMNINSERFISSDLTLSEIINLETNESYIDILNAIKNIFIHLKSSLDIPIVTQYASKVDKNLFFYLLQDIFLDIINQTNKYDPTLKSIITTNYSVIVLVRTLPLIDDAYKKVMSNVNFQYILDILLFNILKEKFLCK